jgi:hypothetical protein
MTDDRDAMPTITSTSWGRLARPILRTAGDSEAVNLAATAGARLAVYCRLYTVYDKCDLNTGQLSSGDFACERRSRSPAAD